MAIDRDVIREQKADAARKAKKTAGQPRAKPSASVSGEPVMTSGQFAPVTWRVGFLKVPFEDLLSGLHAWYEDLGPRGDTETRSVKGTLAQRLHLLEPLQIGSRRDLIVDTGSGWCAWFSGNLLGGLDRAPHRYMATRLKCEALMVNCHPAHLTPIDPDSRFVGLQFDLLDGRLTGEFQETVRSISFTRDGKSQRFEAFGEVQPFEDVAAYALRAKSQRFTLAMFDRYCRALGIDFFNDDFYSGKSAFITAPTVRVGPDVSIDGYRDYRIAEFGSSAT